MGRCGHRGSESLCAGFDFVVLVVSRSVHVSGAQIVASPRAMQAPVILATLLGRIEVELDESMGRVRVNPSMHAGPLAG